MSVINCMASGPTCMRGEAFLASGTTTRGDMLLSVSFRAAGKTTAEVDARSATMRDERSMPHSFSRACALFYIRMHTLYEAASRVDEDVDKMRQGALAFACMCECGMESDTT